MSSREELTAYTDNTQHGTPCKSFLYCACLQTHCCRSGMDVNVAAVSRSQWCVNLHSMSCLLNIYLTSNSNLKNLLITRYARVMSSNRGPKPSQSGYSTSATSSRCRDVRARPSSRAAPTTNAYARGAKCITCGEPATLRRACCTDTMHHTEGHACHQSVAKRSACCCKCFHSFD